ncbi:MAG: SPOR domain-containing protein [Deltaproteobacteria bacterium]|nr:SPOR domain-containing protein [Deltaproteobacteria bacterium]
MPQYDINLREYWRVLKKRKIIIIFTTILLGIFSTFFAMIQAPTPLYTSSCSIKFEKETTLEGLYARTLSWTGGDDIETQISIIKSYSIMKEVAVDMGLVPSKISQDTGTPDPGIISVVERLQARMTVERENYTNILNIRITDTDRYFAQRMANTVASTYKRLHAEQQGKRTREAINYIDDQLEKMRQKLREAEREFNTFSQKNQLLSIDLQSENLLSRSKEIKDEIRSQAEIKREIKGLIDRLKRFIDDPSRSDTNFYSINAGQQYQTSNDKFVELLLQRDTLLENYTDKHPEVISNGYKIIENARKMLMLLNLEMENLEKREIGLNQELMEIDGKTNLLMEKKLEYDRLKREVESFRDMTALLERKNQEAQITKAEKPDEIVIVKPAILPMSPINPPKITATGIMGAMIGIVLGLVLAFIIETFDTSLGAIEDVEETIGAKVLGVIPYADPKDIQEVLKDRYPDGMDEHAIARTINLVTHFTPKTMMAESFRALRTNIQFREGDEKLKTLGVTSTSPQEGKTTVSINLAIAMAQAGQKTLLVGSDLRKPMLAKVFGLEIIPGLTDILLGNYPWRDTVKTITDMIMGKMSMDELMMTPGMDNLHIITCGTIPPNPAELIESKRLNGFIEEAKKEYDIIIFDSIPVLSTADAAILATKVDGMLIVYRVGAVSKGLLKRTSTQLEQVNCNIVGVVLNGMKPDISPDFQDFKYYKYYYSYGEESGKKSNIFSRLFSFIKTDEGVRKPRHEGLPASSPDFVKKKEKRKTSSGLKVFLLFIAILLLAAGFLWREGLIDPGIFQRTEQPVDHELTPPNPVEKKTVNDEQDIIVTSDEGTPKIIPIEEEETEAIVDAISPPIPLTAVEEGVKKEEETLSPYLEGSYPFSLYMGSFQTLERAKKAVSMLKEKGLPSFWVKVSLGEKGEWYRIYLGNFKNSDEAEQFGRERNLDDITVKKTEYANLVGTYISESELESDSERIKELGFSPYGLNDSTGLFRLFVGAFLTEEGANTQKEILKSAGIYNQVVLR